MGDVLEVRDDKTGVVYEIEYQGEPPTDAEIGKILAGQMKAEPPADKPKTARAASPGNISLAPPVSPRGGFGGFVDRVKAAPRRFQAALGGDIERARNSGEPMGEFLANAFTDVGQIGAAIPRVLGNVEQAVAGPNRRSFAARMAQVAKNPEDRARYAEIAARETQETDAAQSAVGAMGQGIVDTVRVPGEMIGRALAQRVASRDTNRPDLAREQMARMSAGTVAGGVDDAKRFAVEHPVQAGLLALDGAAGGAGLVQAGAGRAASTLTGAGGVAALLGKPGAAARLEGAGVVAGKVAGGAGRTSDYLADVGTLGLNKAARDLLARRVGKLLLTDTKPAGVGASGAPVRETTVTARDVTGLNSPPLLGPAVNPLTRPDVSVFAPEPQIAGYSPGGAAGPGVFRNRAPEPSAATIEQANPGGLVAPTGGSLRDRALALRQQNAAPVAPPRTFTERVGTGARKVGVFTQDVLRAPNTLKTTFDLSAPLRQGAPLTIARPKAAAAAMGEMFRSLSSEKGYKAAQEAIATRPNAELYKQAGIEFTALADDTTSGAALTLAEEAYASRLLEKVPGIRHSERAYIAYLNRLRADAFDQSVKHLQHTPMTTAQYDTATKSLGRYINAATGRGSLGAFEKAAEPLAGVIWAPRLVASRVQLMNPIEYAKMPKAVRVQALRDMGTGAGALAAVLMAGKLSGKAEVSTDLRDADAFKLKIGDTRVDVGAGFIQYIRLAALMKEGERITSAGRVKKLDGKGKYPETRLSTAGKFVEQRTTPTVALAIKALRGWKDADGRDVKMSDEAINTVAPMLAKDLYEAYQADPKTGAAVTLPALFGASVSTYGDEGGGEEFAPAKKGKYGFSVGAPPRDRKTGQFTPRRVVDPAAGDYDDLGNEARKRNGGKVRPSKPSSRDDSDEE